MDGLSPPQARALAWACDRHVAGTCQSTSAGGPAHSTLRSLRKRGLVRLAVRSHPCGGVFYLVAPTRLGLDSRLEPAEPLE